MAVAAQTHHGACGQDSFGRFAERTKQVAELTREIHALICKPGEPAAG